MQYQTFRSVSDVHVFVLCYDSKFYESVPEKFARARPVAGSAPRRGRVPQARVSSSARAGRVCAGEV